MEDRGAGQIVSSLLALQDLQNAICFSFAGIEPDCSLQCASVQLMLEHESPEILKVP